MDIIKYPDGTSYVKEDDLLRTVTFKTNSYEDLWHLNQYVDMCNHNGFTPTIFIPNLLDAQADKRFNHNESTGLKLVCKFLNKIKANFEIFHPHNPEVLEALLDNVFITDNTHFIKEVISDYYCHELKGIKRNLGVFYHQKQDLYNNLILMSSDAGGFKPLMKLCDKLDWKGETISASKSRKYDSETKKSKLTQIINTEDFKGKDILIVDDICVYGGTFIGLANLLKERNCRNLYLAVSHMTVKSPNILLETDFKKVFTTNSKFEKEEYSLKNLEIIKIC